MLCPRTLRISGWCVPKCVPFSMHPLYEASLVRCVPCTMRLFFTMHPLYDAYLARRVPRTMLALNKASLVRCVLRKDVSLGWWQVKNAATLTQKCEDKLNLWNETKLFEIHETKLEEIYETKRNFTLEETKWNKISLVFFIARSKRNFEINFFVSLCFRVWRKKSPKSAESEKPVLQLGPMLGPLCLQKS
jgi:hypothetical protein